LKYRNVLQIDLFRLAFVKSMTSLVMNLTLNCGEPSWTRIWFPAANSRNMSKLCWQNF